MCIWSTLVLKGYCTSITSSSVFCFFVLLCLFVCLFVVCFFDWILIPVFVFVFVLFCFVLFCFLLHPDSYLLVWLTFKEISVFLPFSIFQIRLQHSDLWDTLRMMLFTKRPHKKKMHWQNQLKNLAFVHFMFLYWIRHKKLDVILVPCPFKQNIFSQFKTLPQDQLPQYCTLIITKC